MKKLFYIIVLAGVFAASYYATKFIINKPITITVPEPPIPGPNPIPAPDPEPDPIPVEISNEELKSLIINGNYTKDNRIAENCMAEYEYFDTKKTQQNDLAFIQKQIQSNKWSDFIINDFEKDNNTGKVNLVRITPNIKSVDPGQVKITTKEIKELIQNGKYVNDKRIAKEYSIQYMDVSDDDIEGLQQNLTFVQQQIEFGNWKDFSVNGFDYDKKSGKVNIIKIQPIY